MIIATKQFASVQGTRPELLVEFTLLIHALLEKGVLSERDIDMAVNLGKMDIEELKKERESVIKKRSDEIDELLNGLKDLAKVLEEVSDGE